MTECIYWIIAWGFLMLVGMGSIGSVVGMYCVDFTTMNGAITGGVIGAIIGGSIGAFIGFFVGRDC